MQGTNTSVETNPSNIRIFPTDIHFIAAWWYYAADDRRENTDVR